MGNRINKGKRFDEKVAKAIDENLRHDSEKTDWAWRHVHTKHSDSDPVWRIAKDVEEDINEDENQGD